jgi:hypothetical protein
MGFFYFLPDISTKVNYVKEYIKDYFIILYFDFISSSLYLDNKKVFYNYLEAVKLAFLSGYITHVGERCFYVPFRTNSETYKIPLIFTEKQDISKAIDENGKDLSPFLGPYKNFFGIQLTPRDIGCKEVLLVFEDDSHKRFTENETIIF